MRTIICANGILKNPRTLVKSLKPDDFLIAADGGLGHFLFLGIFPNIVIGDLDSITPEQLKTLQSKNVEIIRHPARKDETDLELALLYAVEQGATEILVYGALGARWDMTLGNILLLAHPRLRIVNIILVDENQEVRLLTGGETLTLSAVQVGDTVSLLPLGGDAVGVTTRGLGYPLHGENLKFALTRGLSNVVKTNPVQISLEKGLLCVIKEGAKEPKESEDAKNVS